MTHAERNELWKNRISDYQNSGLTMRNWCHQHQMNFHTFKYWLQKIQTNNQPTTVSDSQWFALDLNRQVASTPAIQLFVGGVHVEVSKGFDPQLLCEIIHALKTC